MTTPAHPSRTEELAALYKAMTPWAQDRLMRTAQAYAKTWPAKRGGHLRLVSPVEKHTNDNFTTRG